jgi:tetratricopeptide (TPR) repeat protein/predicted aspartyl protease
MQVPTRKLSSSERDCCRIALLLLFATLLPGHAAAKCKLSKALEFPITMAGLTPMLAAKINGADAHFVLDSGASYSLISAATAAEFKLRLEPAPEGLRLWGVGGSTEPSIATVKDFTIAGITLHHVEFLVGGGETGGGLLGQNFLQAWDVEYDLAKGVVRLFKAEDCKHTRLSYWVPPDQSPSMMDIDAYAEASTKGVAFINDTKIRVQFDSGAWTSVISLKAAARAGVKPDMPGVVDAGYTSGVGRRMVKTYIAPFASFKIGDDEEIKNTKLRIAEVDLGDTEMLVGADFFLSHHLYVANSQHRIYFTYNGGPVFNLSKSTSAQSPADAAGPAATADTDKHDEPADAAAFSRRGAAFAGRRDFEHALKDLTRAVELNPNEAEYLYQRGMVYWETEKPVPAMADFDRTLSLKPDYQPALLSRAQLRLDNKDNSGAGADLDAADRIAPKQADDRFTLAQLYASADLFGPAVAQYDLWIANHPDDSKMVKALNGRCWARALQGEGLSKALSDCNSALRRSEKGSEPYARILDSRGLVQLRLGAYDKSIADYDESLKRLPKNAWSLYGRGLAKLRKKNTAEGEADIGAATAIWSSVADNFKRHGIVP